RHGIGRPIDGASPACAEAPRACAGTAAAGACAGAGAGHVVSGRPDWKQSGLSFPNDGARLLISSGRGGDRLIGDFDLRQERIERAVLIDRPPIAARYVVARRGTFPAFELLVMGRYRCRLARVIRAERAAG